MMIANRFSDELICQPRLAQHAKAGFLVISIASNEPGQASPLPWLYQQIYEKASQAQLVPKWRNLFTVMN